MDDGRWVDEVLTFWFGHMTEEDWFSVKPGTDADIRKRFASLWEDMQQSVPAIAFRAPEAALAATIVLDQFPRNMFRKTAKAFSSDALALAVAGNAVHQGFDRGMDAQRQQFLYMPFMHSETLADQERCVELFSGARAENKKFAALHRDIIKRFGRFPHRNEALGRQSTQEERAFLADSEGFGQ